MLSIKKDWAKAQNRQLTQSLAIIVHVKLSRATADTVETARSSIAKTTFKRATSGPDYSRAPAVVNRYYAALQHCLGPAQHKDYSCSAN